MRPGLKPLKEAHHVSEKERHMRWLKFEMAPMRRKRTKVAGAIQTSHAWIYVESNGSNYK
jgi:hypothetical protein